MDRKSLIILAVVLTVVPTFSAFAAVYKCADGNTKRIRVMNQARLLT